VLPGLKHTPFGEKNSGKFENKNNHLINSRLKSLFFPLK